MGGSFASGSSHGHFRGLQCAAQLRELQARIETRSGTVCCLLRSVDCHRNSYRSDLQARRYTITIPVMKGLSAIARLQGPTGSGLDALTRTGAAESKALILLLTFFPQCVVSMLSMTPPVMASHIAHSLGISPKITGLYVGLIYAGAILSSSFSASLITRLGPLRTSCVCVVTAGAGLALLSIPHLPASLLATAIIGLSYGPLTPASSHVLARYRSGSGMAFLVSVRQTSVPMGGVLAGFVAPPLVLGLGWNSACVVIGGVIAALGAVVWISVAVVRNELPDEPHGHSASLFEPVRFIFRSPGLAS